MSSKSVDQRVVEMRFENSNFEKNAATSIGTLAKLKQSLNLSGASKGLERVNAAAGKVNMGGLGSAVETVTAKFSAMQVMGVTALANITNSVVNAGKNFVNALTIAPVKDGFSEYEMTLNAVQTTMSATGKTAKEVEKELKKLDEYADKTVYSTADMLNNLPKFTNAGVDLEVATKAMIGIANATAHAGGDASKASIAFYNLGQAIGTGYLTRMDYNSINNAGIATMEWKKQMVEAAIAQGTLAKAGEDLYTANGKNFTLQQLFIDGLQEQWATTDVMTNVFSKYGDETTDIGKKAYSAAQDIKTFSMMMDSLKATAGTGWKDTWQIIFGGLDEAKVFWTGLNNFISKIIGSITDFRNGILEGALSNNPFSKITDRIQEIIKPAQKAAEAVKQTISTIENLDEIARKVIRGDYKNTDTGRRQNLMAEGYNWAIVQNRVNEMLGNSKRHSVEAAEAELQLYKAEHGLVEKGNELNKTQEDINQARADSIDELLKMSDAELKLLGLTDDEIKALRELAKICDLAGIKLSDAINDPSLLNGRNLLINSFKNIGEGIVEFATIIEAAWKSIFPPKTIEERAAGLHKLLAIFHGLTNPLKSLLVDTGQVDEAGNKIMKLSDTGEKLVRTFKGIFAALDIVLTVLGGPLRLAFKVIVKILDMFDLHILDVTASVGDVIVLFRDWLKQTDIIGKALRAVVNGAKSLISKFLDLPIVQKIVDKVTSKVSTSFNFWKQLFTDLVTSVRNGTMSFGGAVKKFGGAIWEAFINNPIVKTIRSWVGAFMALPEVQKCIEKFKGVIEGFRNSTTGRFGEAIGRIKNVLSEAIDIGKNLIAGLQQGLNNGTIKIKDAIIQLGSFVIDTIKKLFGIHSPSTVMFAIGGFIIAGLVGGLLAGSTDLTSAIQGIGQKCADFFNGINWGKIFAVGMSGAMVYFVKKILDIFSTLVSPLENVGDLIAKCGLVVVNFGKLLGSFSKVMKGFAANLRAKALKDIAIALAILVGAIVVLTFFDTKELWKSVAIVAALGGVLLVLSLVMEKLSKASITISKNGGSVQGLQTSLLAIAGALLILALTVRIIGNMDPDKAKQGFLGLGGLVLAIVGVLAAFGKLVKGKAAMNIDKAGVMLRKMSTTMLILVIVAKMIARMEWSDMGKAAVGLLGLVGIIALLMTISMIPSKNVKKLGSMLLKISVALAALVIVAKMISRMEWTDMGKAAVGLLGLVGIIALLMTISMIPGRNVDLLGSMLLKISIALAALVIVAKMIARMEWSDMGKAAVGLLGLVGIIALLTLITKIAGKDVPKIAGTLLAMSVSIGILAAIAIFLGLIDLGSLAKGIIAVGMLSLFMVMMGFATKLMPADAKATLVGLAISIGVMAAAIAALSFIDIKSLTAATVALGSIMGVFALMAKTASGMQNQLGNLLAMIAVIGTIAIMLYLLSSLPAESTLSAALSLSVVMLAMSGAMRIISGVGKFTKDALLGVVALLAMAVPLLAFVGVLAVMQNVKNATANAMTLIALATAMTVLLIPLTAIGLLGMTGAPYLGVLALLTMAVPMLAFIGVLALMNNIQNAQSNAALLISLMTVMTDLLVKVSIVAPLAVIGVGALAALSVLMVAIGALAVGIGALMEKFPQLEDFLDKGIPILVKLAEGIGLIVGSLIAGLAVGVMSALPTIAAQLSSFMILVQPFINGAKQIDDKVMTGVGILTAAILLLTVADFINGIVSLLPNCGSFAQLGYDLSDFMDNLQPFIAGASALDPSIVDSVKALAETILILTGANLIEGITSFITGGSSIADFANEIVPFGEAMTKFSKTVSGNIDESAVTAASNAGKVMAEMAAALPNSGGVVGFFAGNNDLETFGEHLEAFGGSVVDFSRTVSGNIDESAITAAANAGKVMAEMAAALPNTGGVVSWFAGDNDLETFGEHLESFGGSIVDFSRTVSGNIDEEAITAAANAGAIMAEMASNLENTGGVVSWFAGDNDLETFGEHLESFGDGLLDYSDSVDGLNVDAVLASVEAANGLADLQNGLCDTGGVFSFFTGDNDLETFGENLEDFGDCLYDYFSEIEGIDANQIEKTSDAITAITRMAETAQEVDSESMKILAENLRELAVNGVGAFVEGFEYSGIDVHGAGEYLMGEIILGVQSRMKYFRDTIEAYVNVSAKTISDNKASLESAGKDLGNGLVIGIKAKEDAVYNAAYALGQKAVQGEKDGQASNSPSKLTIQAGKWLGEGLVLGIGNMTKAVYKAGHGLGESATKSISSTISRIGDLVNSDIDAQPTIRPVLDLSEVSSGVGALNGMFNNNPSIGLTSNLSAISSLHDSRQNGNDDVVSAINKLGKTLNNLPSGDNYNINGITYSNGNEVSDAVNVLVRATMMEGRV